MDLATVRVKVKTWEKEFRATNKRAPTKEDIKQDESNIAEMYALYRRLSKGRASSSSSSATTLAPPPTGTPQKPRAGPPAPATPTPPARRRASQAAPSFSRAHDESPEAGPSSTGAPITPQKRGALFSTPKKTQGYVGPVQDPLPNPFSVTPRKNKLVSANNAFESPFIHATSPRKLKELLEANSLRSTRERASALVEITPRTKARKRLAGEEVEFTPVKAPRRRRGDRPSAASAIPGARPAAAVVDSNDEFGETPIKPGVASFGFVDDTKSRSGPSNGKVPTNGNRNGKSTYAGKGPNDLFPIFQRAKRAAEGTNAENGRAKRRTVAPSEDEDEDEDGPGSPAPLSAAPTDDGSVSSFSAASAAPSEDERLPTPTGTPSAPKESNLTPRPTRDHVLTLSDDEWDPEAAARTVRVVGTRRVAIRMRPDAGLASDDEMDEEPQVNGHDHDHDSEDEDDNNDEDGSKATTTPRLSFLSLRSPIARVGERLADLRVRALLDPTSAAATALRAARRGQDVFVCGEVDGEGDEEWDMQVEVQVEGDDDWESDPEGWKATPGEDDW